MGILVISNKPTKIDIKKAREDFPNYIKITADISQEFVAIGGEYHADAEETLLLKYGSRQKDIWGGGYNITLDKFEVNAMINIRQPENDSPDILDLVIRKKFLKLVKKKLSNIKSLI